MLRVSALTALSAIALSGCATPLPDNGAPTWLLCKWRAKDLEFHERATGTTEKHTQRKGVSEYRVRLSGSPYTPRVLLYSPKSQQIQQVIPVAVGPDTLLFHQESTTQYGNGDRSVTLWETTIDRKTLKFHASSQNLFELKQENHTQHLLSERHGSCRIIPPEAVEVWKPTPPTPG